MGAPQNVDVDGLKRENEQLRAELEKLRKSKGNVGGGGGPAGAGSTATAGGGNKGGNNAN
jgi:hypothetical protein